MTLLRNSWPVNLFGIKKGESFRSKIYKTKLATLRLLPRKRKLSLFRVNWEVELSWTTACSEGILRGYYRQGWLFVCYFFTNSYTMKLKNWMNVDFSECCFGFFQNIYNNKNKQKYTHTHSSDEIKTSNSDSIGNIPYYLHWQQSVQQRLYKLVNTLSLYGTYTKCQKYCTWCIIIIVEIEKGTWMWYTQW